MQKPDCSVYFSKRAGEERAAAERAGDERAAQCHRDLAAHYDAMAKAGSWQSAEDGPALNILPNEFRILP